MLPLASVRPNNKRPKPENCRINAIYPLSFPDFNRSAGNSFLKRPLTCRKCLTRTVVLFKLFCATWERHQRVYTINDVAHPVTRPIEPESTVVRHLLQVQRSTLLRIFLNLLSRTAIPDFQDLLGYHLVRLDTFKSGLDFSQSLKA